MNDDEHYIGVGQRVANARRLVGLTQRQLADRAHVGLGTIRHVEQARIPASPSFVSSVARALGVTPAHLYGTREEDAIEQPSELAAVVGELRAALDAYDDPRPDGRPLTLDAITSRLDSLAHDLRAERFADTATALPPLLHHLYPLADHDGHDGDAARAALHDAYRMAASVAGQFRQFDLAALASERHITLAPRTGDPLRVAVSAWHRSTRYLQHGDFRAGLRMLDRAREHIDTSPHGHAVAVQLDLRAAMLATRAGDANEGDGWLDEARALITQHQPPERPYYNVDASALNLTVHWCALPVEQYNGTESARRGETVHVHDRTRPERVGHHHIDQARAWTLHGDRERALAHLQTARRVAPRRTRQHPQVRETVVTLAQRDRRRDDTLAGFARWADIRV